MKFEYVEDEKKGIKEVLPGVSKPIVVIPEAKPKKVKTISTPKTTEEFLKLTMDEVRAYYIVICKKSPKHDSNQTKEVLINEIIETLKLSI